MTLVNGVELKEVESWKFFKLNYYRNQIKFLYAKDNVYRLNKYIIYKCTVYPESADEVIYPTSFVNADIFVGIELAVIYPAGLLASYFKFNAFCKSVWFDSVPVIDPQVPPPTPPLPGFCKYPDICLYIN